MTSTDEAAFIRAVCLNPADDTARLVYADWLEEQGGDRECGCARLAGAGYGTPKRACPACSGTGRVSNGFAERAEFIRVQVELEKMRLDNDGKYPMCLPNHGPLCQCTLRRRERELLAQHWGQWRPAILSTVGDTIVCRNLVPEADDVPMAGDVAIEFRRGFVYSVSAPLAVLFGGPCGVCNGVSPRVQLMGADGPSAVLNCPDCSGTGTTPGVAAELWRSQPVQRMALVGKEPYGPDENDGWCSWFSARFMDETIAERDGNTIPDRLFDLMAGGELVRGGNHLTSDEDICRFPTRAAALDVLSAAAVALGRERAGLPALVIS